MSSEGTGSVRKTAARRIAQGKSLRRRTAAKPESPVPSSDAYDDDLADPWFAPGPKAEYVDAGPAGAEGRSVQGEWFLPTGRAGLLPDSMTESWDDSDTAQADHGERAEAVGAPPWGPDSASAAAGEPPPWETGPWPGPGEEATERPRLGAVDPAAARNARARATAEPATDLEPGRERTQRSRLIMVGGAAVVVLIIAIVVIVSAASGGPGTGCATYPAPVRQAYARAMSDLSGNAAPAVQAADLGRAAGLANASAAAAGQITARSALFAMASDLDEAYTDVTRHRPVTSDLQQRLTSDGTALPRTCPS
jgi:hypothetical protein